MAIVGFNFTKISVEKLSDIKGKINISNNVAIVSVEKTELSLGTDKQGVLKFGFEFTSKYDPKVGAIELKGDVLYLDNPKNITMIVEEWKKNKKIPNNIMTNLLNNILNKCNIEALILSKDINLPPPIPLPKVKEAGAGGQS